MKISLNWINDYVDIENVDKFELARNITNGGVKVESISSFDIPKVIVGHVIDCVPHPDSDHLKVCKVDNGFELLQIICGAPNVAKDQKVPVALIGAVLPGDFTILERAVRGVTSFGMICSEKELGLGPDQEGIMVLDPKTKIGIPLNEALGLDDVLYTLDLKPNHNDCLSHLGFAHEVSSVLNKKIKYPETKTHDTHDSVKNYFKLDVQTDNCSLYVARMVKDVKIGPSPDFIKKRLEICGMRSINNVVDISNYIMLEYGQPLHFFDKEKLGDQIVVRQAMDKEKVITLDEQERILDDQDIVITDGKEIVAIAGVMGALNTDVDNNTKDILIESAIFDPFKVRYTSLKLGLRSEASLRFEKGVNFEYTYEAIERACYLLEKYAGGTILSDKVIHDKVDKTPKKVTITLDKINKILGTDINLTEVCSILDVLDFSYTLDKELLEIIIPNRRMDVFANENDIAEEIGRLYGYDKLIEELPKLSIIEGSYQPFTKYRKDISKKLRGLLLNEVKTYTLVNPSEAELFKTDDYLKVLYPNSLDKSVIRRSILPSLLKVYDYNKARNVNNINIYEISNVYDADYKEETKLAILMSDYYISPNFNKTSVEVDFYLLKGIIENIINYLGLDNRCNFVKLNKFSEELHLGMSASIMIDNEEIGFLGKINPQVKKEDIYVLEISLSKLYNKKTKRITYQEISKYPEITKDVAFILDKDISSSEVMKLIKQVGTKLLTNIEVFDLYDLEDKKSLAYSLTFSNLDRTLTEEEVDIIFKNIIKNVCDNLKAKIRDK